MLAVTTIDANSAELTLLSPNESTVTSASNAKQSYDLTLTRAVAMFRLVLTDEEIPSNVAKLKFYYVGGSSTFSPKDGYGA